MQKESKPRTNDDLVGRRFGRLLVVSYAGSDKHKKRNWICRCDCGNEIKTATGCLTTGNTSSCGCLTIDRIKESKTTHGHKRNKTYTPEYQAWLAIKNRCYNPKYKQFHDYGGRGIGVSPRWLNSFENFLSDMGFRPSPKHSIDRYPNNDGNYEPGNCRWATSFQQGCNKRYNVWLEYNGERMIYSDWVRKWGINGSTLYFHLNKKKKPFSEIYNHFEKKIHEEGNRLSQENKK